MLRIPAPVLTAIVAHARSTTPEECCGLLAMDLSGAVVGAYPVGNVERSPVRFTVDPDGHFSALRSAEAQGWALGGVYHSHPRSTPVPSRTDLTGALDPEWVHLIVGLVAGVPEVRAWRIVGGEAIEVPIEENA
ncbi:MAG TPA: M67 family metallopeptidase [Acidimicrobiia bacterium]|nr:M67 family metallopeptidase [Acidimicrobiia bacterium]